MRSLLAAPQQRHCRLAAANGVVSRGVSSSRGRLLVSVSARAAVQERQRQRQRQQRQQQQRQPHKSAAAAPATPAAATAAAAAAVCLLATLPLPPPAAAALQVLAEPANALSLPTWAIHVSSVAEWVIAIALFWRYADVTGNQTWKGLSWGMLPALGSAMSACTWHFFYNAPELDWLVALQAGLTVVGNATCWLAAYRIYKSARAVEGQKS